MCVSGTKPDSSQICNSQACLPTDCRLSNRNPTFYWNVHIGIKVYWNNVLVVNYSGCDGIDLCEPITQLQGNDGILYAKGQYDGYSPIFGRIYQVCR